MTKRALTDRSQLWRKVTLLRSTPALMVVTATSFALSACGNLGDSSGSDPGIVETLQSAVIIGDSGQPGTALDYFQCATENGTCRIGGAKYLSFGADGRFVFKQFNGSVPIPCTRDSFDGNDPAPGIVKACYFANYSFVASENQTGNVGTFPRNVAFGANGVFHFAMVTGAYNCNVATFGDPLFGVPKACYIAVRDHEFLANEGGTLSSLNNTAVAYGANGVFRFKVASGSLPCTNANFPSPDPAPGVPKACYPLKRQFIAHEGNSFIAGSGSLFYYTSGLNGNVFTKSLSGTVTCSTATFGADPDPAHAKHCYF
jgi:hypothetical protein